MSSITQSLVKNNNVQHKYKIKFNSYLMTKLKQNAQTIEFIPTLGTDHIVTL